MNVALTPIQEVLQQETDACPLPELRTAPVIQALDRLYRATGYISIWQDQERVDAFQQQLLDLSADGLNPREYIVPAAEDVEPVCAELHYSALYLLALEHLSRGRLDQQKHEPVWQSDSALPPVRVGVAQLGILGLEDMAAAFKRARPSFYLYRQLRTAYQQMDADLPDLAPFPDGPLIKPGATDPRLPQLSQRLILTGYFNPDASAGPLDRPLTDPDLLYVQPLTYDEHLQQAVRAFQREHGLQPDAVVGPQTVAALNLSPQERQQRVRINLERLRWLDARRQHHSLVSNAAGSNALLFEGDELRWKSRVQSGTADRPTPPARLADQPGDAQPELDHTADHPARGQAAADPLQPRLFQRPQPHGTGYRRYPA